MLLFSLFLGQLLEELVSSCCIELVILNHRSRFVDWSSLGLAFASEFVSFSLHGVCVDAEGVIQSIPTLRADALEHCPLKTLDLVLTRSLDVAVDGLIEVTTLDLIVESSHVIDSGAGR